jgi:hypothetical protein
MIIIAGYTVTESAQRDAAVKAFADPDRINLFECWRGQSVLESLAKGRKRRAAAKEICNG